MGVAGAAAEPPPDDASVNDDLVLFRRVPPAHTRWTPDGPEIRDGLFKNFPNPELLRMSVVLEDTLREDDRSPETIVAAYPLFGVAAITAAAVRAEQQGVVRSRTEEEPAHGDVCGEKPTSRRIRLAEQAWWVVEPPRGPS